METLRYVSSVPLMMPHVATEGGQLGPYYLPKGTQVRPRVLRSEINEPAVTHHPNTWEIYRFWPDFFGVVWPGTGQVVVTQFYSLLETGKF